MPSTDICGIMAVVADPELRDELDRGAAAVGVRVVHAPSARATSRRAWSAATAVVLDEAAALACALAGLPRRDHVVVVGGQQQLPPSTWAAAVDVGARQVLKLPAQEHDLVRELADAAESARDDGSRGAVLAVIGGCGGAGASLFSLALAHVATDAMLVDVDAWSGGIDLLIGAERAPGVRWPDLTLEGGRLTWSAVRDALPRRRGISVLSGTRSSYEPDGRAVHAVVDAGRRGAATVVCDLPRRLTDAAETAVESADLVVVVSPCDVRACAATAALAPLLAAINPNVGLVVRGPAPGGLRADEVATVAGVPLLASMRPHPRLAKQIERGGVRIGRRCGLAVAAGRVLAALPAQERSDRRAA